jgi:hypothetical protein|tara:strand:+ start:167 stop:388 length:222 start_codon:yes stop_codon:yes gene_type:complete
MATTPIDTWAVDLADVTVIYPWTGSEGLMVLVAVVLWLAWHVWQLKHENATYDQEIQRHGDNETIRNAIDEHH